MCAGGGCATTGANACFLREDVSPCMYEMAYLSSICGQLFLKRGRQLLFLALAEGDVTKYEPLLSSYSYRPSTRCSAL
jgi:hypothetical protein